MAAPPARVLFATASQWVDKLAAAHTSGRPQAELARSAATRGRRGRYTSCSNPEAANLFFQLVTSRYEHASLIVTNKPLGKANYFARMCARWCQSTWFGNSRLVSST
jgi:hypothetical protein